ncbi:MAG: glycosyltransferase family 25 protein [Verrucomicrobiales bacterium]|jgi:glycosyl transferase family 25|nr:glycosyltransferase family 25 protein [Verrucomicrobiales bacterium]
MKTPVHIFIINLPRVADRRAMMTRQLSALGLPFEFVEGVDGRALSAAALAENYDHDKALRERNAMTLPEIGCALSHQKIYRKMAAENIPCALILEDDVKLADDLPDVLTELANRPADGEVVLLGHVPRHLRRGRAPLTVTRALARTHGLCWGAYAYFLDSVAAARLLADAHPVWVVADHWRKFQERGLVMVSAMTPYCAGLTELGRASSIGERGVPRRRGLAGWLRRQRQRYCHAGLPAYLWRTVRWKVARLLATVSGNVVTQPRTW